MVRAHRPAPRRTPLRLVLAAGTAAVLSLTGAGTAGAAPVDPPAAPEARPGGWEAGGYVVTLAGDPLAELDTATPGRPLLRSAPAGVDVSGEAARQHRARLLEEQTSVAEVAGVVPTQSYTVALNGFAADLTAEQAAELAATDGVVSVVPDTRRQLHTTGTPDFLGLTGEDGAWEAVGGVEEAGAGVVVADLDTGVWPEHPSLAGQPLADAPDPDAPGTAHRTAGGEIRVEKSDGGVFTGRCETGEGWTADDCTTKIVGARAFAQGFLAAAGDAGLAEGEYFSARDSDGHGTHTTTTAAGLAGVSATIDGREYGEASGAAPAAAVAAYKVCWTSGDGDSGCQTSDLVAAIDAAVADNVDVINFSIGSGTPATTVNDPVELAFLSAASAGIFVAASAGNSGPGTSTLDHASPWITTVAASTAVPREGTVVLGDGSSFVGARLVQEPLPRTRAVLGSAVAAAGRTAADAQLCRPGSLDPARAAGRVVVCDRGVDARVDKSAEVARAGGVGVVLVNPTPNSTDPDAHVLPTVHLDTPAGDAVKAYVAARPAATVRFEPGNTTGTPTATPQAAGFSSRGPTLAAGGDVLKPDLAAPGVGIVAGTSPDASRDDLFAAQSGTSMSAPHVAGLAALLLGVHPDWSPMAVKSALMTTARDLVDADGEPAGDPFAGGAGLVDPTAALDPGLVYDSTPRDWVAFLEGTGVRTGTGVPAVAPSELNTPSIAVGALAGRRTVTRSVTAVTGGLYLATADVPGFDVEVSPSVLYVSEGQTVRFRVTFTREDAPLEEWATGSLEWRGAGTAVRSPLAVRPVAVIAPREVRAAHGDGTAAVEVVPGRTGDLDVTTAGLVAGRADTGQVRAGQTREHRVRVPEGTSLVRFDLLSRSPGADLDLYVSRVVRGNQREDAGASASPAGDERVDLVDPEPGTYVVEVDGYATAPGERTAAYEHTSFVVGGTGDLVVEPDPVPVRAGTATTVTARWGALDERRRYLGWIGWEGARQRTVVAVG
ncbi:S8 family serine peptidase [Kineococcus sp. SYSU DK004]|uniref:S8 family serine peptidase n=1 Tax=Kineococcus sp. SYSU DK004 TaxID=3383125 RepID=UPI003D7D49FA